MRSTVNVWGTLASWSVIATVAVPLPSESASWLRSNTAGGPPTGALGLGAPAGMHAPPLASALSQNMPSGHAVSDVEGKVHGTRQTRSWHRRPAGHSLSCSQFE